MAKQITAAVVREAGRMELAAVTLDDPRDNEVLVRIVACGVCHTDLAVLDQHLPWPLPAVLGHEGAGVVEAVGAAVTKVKPGDKVVLSFASCGGCAPCHAGQVSYCDNFMPLNFYGRRTDGSATHTIDAQPVSAPFFYQSAFATYALASDRNTIRVADDADLTAVAPLGCGVQTGAGAVFNRLKPRAGSSLVVFGMGAVGLSAVMAGHAAGCTPIAAVDLVDSRLELAMTLGASHAVRGDAEDLADQLKALSGGGFQYAVEATGVPKVMASAASALRTMGEAVLLGVPGPQPITFQPDIMRGVTIHSSVEGDSDPEEMIPRLIALNAEGRLPYERMIKTFAFTEINAAVAATKDGSAVKPVLVMPAAA